mmetsp:Transcript_8419/g.18871  ORF Transcript_8419/g.18871 Transcript_8419/m.18871 type:complete len:148 (-) Transcript_8419:171-614(-)|eukprot:CAMPEP_0172331178 /NCGR_PEP_ID=MMETSP1058-20130122/61793_1 /TAXON_ID=83371 /ORGANISM="Detonula confervacea, Strain CCMP 353" /LENGTH=147 /DNA_ID=CAMNT_0013048433 /DNA_START=304 /DNA_END=747 /DNA_ORIENTATION=-
MEAASTSSPPSIETTKVLKSAFHQKSLLKQDHGFTNNSRNPAKIIVIKQGMKENLVFIREKAKECQKINGVISQKVAENARLCSEVTASVAMEEARLEVLEKKMEEVHFKVAMICGENRFFTRDVGVAWEHMFDVRGNLKMFSSGAS